MDRRRNRDGVLGLIGHKIAIATNKIFRNIKCGDFIRIPGGLGIVNWKGLQVSDIVISNASELFNLKCRFQRKITGKKDPKKDLQNQRIGP